MPEVRHLTRDLIEDFHRLHSDANDAGWCKCAAWWVPNWEGFSERTAEENCRLRDDLFTRGEFDGYLAYEKGEPVGWCQVVQRDKLDKLVRQYQLVPNPSAYAITCFFIPALRRRHGLARRMLKKILTELWRMGVTRVEAFPRVGEKLSGDDLWTGPFELYKDVGFEVVREDPERPVMAINLEKWA